MGTGLTNDALFLEQVRRDEKERPAINLPCDVSGTIGMLRHILAADLGTDRTKEQKIGPVSSMGWMDGGRRDRWKFYIIKKGAESKRRRTSFTMEVTINRWCGVEEDKNHFVLFCQLVHLLLGINVKYIGVWRRLVVFLEAFRRRANLQSLFCLFMFFRSQIDHDTSEMRRRNIGWTVL